MAAHRSTDYLAGRRFAVVGRGSVATTAADVLTVLGAAVDRLDAPPGDGDHDAVICDRVAAGADAAHRAAVARWLEPRPGDAARAWVSVTAFGLDGPAASFRGSDVVCAAAGGLLAAATDTKGRVHQMPGEQALSATGQLAVLAALHGISSSHERRAAVHHDLSAQEAVAFASIQQDLAHVLYRCGGRGGAGRYSAPAGVFACADGEINIIVIDDHQFARVADVLDQPDWVTAYPAIGDRVEHGDQINAVVAAWARELPKVECERLLQAKGVPATAIRTIDEIAASEQFRARGWPVPEAGEPPPTPAVIERWHRDGEPELADRRSLAALRVVEVTNVLAGPLAGAILGAMGAAVVRLEDEGRLDVYRRNGPFADGRAGLERAAYFHCANFCKRSVAGGVGEEPDVARRAFAWADVTIENVGESRLARVGVRSAPVGSRGGAMSASISGFGRSGPHAGYRGYAPNVHAYAGLNHAIQSVAGAEVNMMTALADYCAAIWVATLASAWWLGGGWHEEHVDLSMAEAIAARLQKLGGHRDAQSGPGVGDDLIVPFGDGRHLAVTLTAADRDRLAAVLGGDGGAPSDVRALLAAACRRDAEGTVRTLQEAAIPAHLARSVAEVAADAQLRARAFFTAVEHGELGRSEILALPWKEAGTVRAGYRAAPLLGHDDAWARRTFIGNRGPAAARGG